jgi:hypothetical protein
MAFACWRDVMALKSARGQKRPWGHVAGMSGLPESGHGWTIYEYAT